MLRSIDDAPQELAEAIREFWPAEQWDNAASISWLESRWNAFAEADTTQGGAIPCGTPIEVRDGVIITAERSISWFQINACNLPPGWNPAHLFNTRHNAGTAHDLYARRGWSPWYFSARALGLL
jgi:hypothetical protein